MHIRLLPLTAAVGHLPLERLERILGQILRWIIQWLAEDTGGLVLDEGEDTERLALDHFCIRRMKFIAVKRLWREKSVMAASGKDGGAPCCGGSGGSGSFCLRWNLGIGAGQASSGEESR